MSLSLRPLGRIKLINFIYLSIEQIEQILLNKWNFYWTNLKTLCTAQKRSVRTLFATAQQPHLRDIFINQKILPLDKLINQQECILAYKVINGIYPLDDFLNRGDVGHQIQLRNIGDLRIPLYDLSTLCSLQCHQYLKWLIRWVMQLIIILYFQ